PRNALRRFFNGTRRRVKGPVTSVTGPFSSTDLMIGLPALKQRPVSELERTCAAADQRAATPETKAIDVLVDGQAGARLDLPAVRECLRRPCDRSAGDSPALASCRPSSLLALEAEAPAGASRRIDRDPASREISIANPLWGAP